MTYLKIVVPKMKLNCIEAELKFRLPQAIWLANLYNTPTTDLKNLKEKIDKEYSNLPFFKRIGIFFAKSFFDDKGDVRKEIAYRRENVRSSEDWKIHFRYAAEVFRNQDLEEIASYVEGKISDYQPSSLLAIQ